MHRVILCVAAFTAAICCSCSGEDPADPPQSPASGATVEEEPCSTLTADDGPDQLTIGRRAELPSDSVVRRSALPKRFPSAAEIRATATPLLDDLPGAVRMIAFWGEPGAHEPWVDTPVTFLGVDGRWRDLTRRELDGGIGWLAAGDGPSPDGTRWVTDSRGKLAMLDLGTGRFTPLPAGQSAWTSWSPDSRLLAIWNPMRSGARRLRDRVAIVDRSGGRFAEVPVKVRNREVFISDDGRITTWRYSTKNTEFLRFRRFDIDGRHTGRLTCAIPAGFPPEHAWVERYDGRYLWLSGLVDRRRFVYRNTVIDTWEGTVVQDVEITGFDPHLTDWVEPGVFVSSIATGPSSLYAVDPETGVVAAISRIGLYPHQSGYENHAHSEFAADLVFD